MPSCCSFAGTGSSGRSSSVSTNSARSRSRLQTSSSRRIWNTASRQPTSRLSAARQQVPVWKKSSMLLRTARQSSISLRREEREKAGIHLMMNMRCTPAAIAAQAIPSAATTRCWCSSHRAHQATRKRLFTAASTRSVTSSQQDTGSVYTPKVCIWPSPTQAGARLCGASCTVSGWTAGQHLYTISTASMRTTSFRCLANTRSPHSAHRPQCTDSLSKRISANTICPPSVTPASRARPWTRRYSTASEKSRAFPSWKVSDRQRQRWRSATLSAWRRSRAQWASRLRCTRLCWWLRTERKPESVIRARSVYATELMSRAASSRNISIIRKRRTT